MPPSKPRKIDGFHPAAALGGASTIFPDFFTTALVALVGRGSCAAQAQDPEDEGAKAVSEEIRIYVADQAAYNAGHLHGVWIDATLELDDIQGQVDAMLAASPVEDAEEYAIHDFEGFDGYLPSR